MNTLVYDCDSSFHSPARAPPLLGVDHSGTIKILSITITNRL